MLCGNSIEYLIYFKFCFCSYATSAFDTNINNDISELNELFMKNEFEMKAKESYIVYLELRNVITDQIKSFRVKYDKDMKLIRIESMPIKWCSIDLRNNCAQNENRDRDLRFSLISQQEIDIDSLDENSEFHGLESSLSQHLKEGIIKKDENGTLRVLNEFRNQSTIYVRHSKFTKYYGNFENWKCVFDLAKVTLPDNLNKKLLSMIRVSLSDSNEYSENTKEGLFKTSSNRKEIIAAFDIDLNNLNTSDIDNVIRLNWFLGQTLIKL